MRELRMKLPEIGFVVATRGMLGMGIGLLLGGRLSPRLRLLLGGTLFAVGAITTIPAVALIASRRRAAARVEGERSIVGAVVDAELAR